MKRLSLTRFITLLVCAILIFSMLPATALAEVERPVDSLHAAERVSAEKSAAYDFDIETFEDGTHVALFYNVDASALDQNVDGKRIIHLSVTLPVGVEGITSCTVMQPEISEPEEVTITSGSVSFELVYDDNNLSASDYIVLRWYDSDRELIYKERAHYEISRRLPRDAAERITVVKNDAFDFDIGHTPDDSPIANIRINNVNGLGVDGSGRHLIPLSITPPEGVTGIDSVKISYRPFREEGGVNATYTVVGTSVDFTLAYVEGVERYGSVIVFEWYEADNLVYVERGDYEIILNAFVDVPVPDNSRIHVTLPEGLTDGVNVDIDVDNGVVDIVLHAVTPETWREVYENCNSMEAIVRIDVDGPDGTNKMWDVQGGMSRDHFDRLVSDTGSFKYGVSSGNGSEIAQFEPNSTGTMIRAIPREWKNHHRYMAWRDENGVLIRSEILTINISRANDAGVVSFPAPAAENVPEDRITYKVLNVETNPPILISEDTDDFEVRKSAGDVEFDLHEIDRFKNEQPRSQLDVTIGKYTDAVSCTVIYRGGSKQTFDSYSLDVNQGVTINSTITRDGTVWADYHNCTLKWTLSDNTTVVTEKIRLSVITTGTKWMDAHWSPVDEARLVVDSIYTDAGLVVEKSDGYIKTSISADLPHIDANLLSDSQVRISPPESIADQVSYCTRNRSGGAMLSDYNESIAQDQLQLMQNNSVIVTQPVLEGICPLSKITVDGVTVYFTLQERSSAVLIEWYDTDGNLIMLGDRRGEYIDLSADRFVLEVTEPVVESMDMISGSVVNPTMVTDDPDMDGCDLKCVMYPQAASKGDAYYFQLEAENASGITTKPSEAVAVVLPYSFTDLTYAEALNCDFNLNHYVDDLDHKLKDRPAIIVDEKGLIFTTASFSPFLLEWTVKKGIDLDLNGGVIEGSTRLPIDENGRVSTLPSPTRDGYDFAGWFTSADGGEQVTASGEFTNDAILYAHWSAKSVSGNGNNGGAAASGNTVSEVKNAPTGTTPIMILKGEGLRSDDSLVTNDKPTGSSFKKLRVLAGDKEILGVYEISLKSGMKTNANPMTLVFAIDANYAGEQFTLVHQKADGTYEYFYATADASGDLTFGPLYELSPFMLVKGTLNLNAIRVPNTGECAQLTLYAAAVFTVAAALAGIALTKRKWD